MNKASFLHDYEIAQQLNIARQAPLLAEVEKAMCNAPGDNEAIETAAEVDAEAARTKAAADIKAKEAELAPAEVTAQEKKAEAAKNSEGDSACKAGELPLQSRRLTRKTTADMKSTNSMMGSPEYPEYFVKEQIQAKYGATAGAGLAFFFPGFILEVCANNEYIVQYTDQKTSAGGQEQEKVHARFIKKTSKKLLDDSPPDVIRRRAKRVKHG